MKIIKSWECNIDDEIQRFKMEAGPTTKDIESVRRIINDVREKGDEALCYYCREFDRVALAPEDFQIRKDEIEAAYHLVSSRFIRAIRHAKKNIEIFQGHIKSNNPEPFKIDGCSSIDVEYRPIEKAGAYIPGGRASYPSSVLMNVVPARAAGVSKIIMVSPPGKDGNISPERLVAANESGVDEIYRLGGPYAIAALAFGTETIPQVDKIVGPGNIYVTIAKKEVFGYVGIDILAGPSEVIIIADQYSNPRFVACDLIAQAEHDPGIAMLVSLSNELVNDVLDEIKGLLKVSERGIAIKSSLDRFGLIIIAQDDDETAMIANKFAPEHLQVMVHEPDIILSKIKNAGAIFVGDYTPVVLGDYLAGPSHVLPTAGTARFFSGLSVNDFLKRITKISYSKKALEMVADDIIEIALSEGFASHAEAIKLRVKELRVERSA